MPAVHGTSRRGFADKSTPRERESNPRQDRPRTTAPLPKPSARGALKRDSSPPRTLCDHGAQGPDFTFYIALCFGTSSVERLGGYRSNRFLSTRVDVDVPIREPLSIPIGFGMSTSSHLQYQGTRRSCS